MKLLIFYISCLVSSFGYTSYIPLWIFPGMSILYSPKQRLLNFLNVVMKLVSGKNNLHNQETIGKQAGCVLSKIDVIINGWQMSDEAFDAWTKIVANNCLIKTFPNHYVLWTWGSTGVGLTLRFWGTSSKNIVKNHHQISSPQQPGIDCSERNYVNNTQIKPIFKYKIL